MTANRVHLFPQPQSSRSAEKIFELSSLIYNFGHCAGGCGNI